MKRFNKITFLCACFALIAMQGSSESSDYYDYYAVYMDRANLEKSVFYVTTGREIKNPGKIYYKYPHLFVNEKYKGVHVIDNRNPANPVMKGFIMAPGCLDMAVKDNVIYLDNAVDLVSFDLDDMKISKRIIDVFPQLAPPSGNVYYGEQSLEDFIIVDWVKH